MSKQYLETVRKWYPNAKTTEDTINGLLQSDIRSSRDDLRRHQGQNRSIGK